MEILAYFFVKRWKIFHSTGIEIAEDNSITTGPWHKRFKWSRAVPSIFRAFCIHPFWLPIPLLWICLSAKHGEPICHLSAVLIWLHYLPYAVQMINNTKLELPFLTARQLLQSRRRLRNSIRRGKEVAESSDLLEQIDGELQSRRDLRFQNAFKKTPALYRGLKDENL